MQVEKIEKGVNVAIKTGNWAQRNPLALAFVIMIISIGGTWLTMKSQMKDLREQTEDWKAAYHSKEKELKEWQYIVVPRLEKIQPTVEATAQKIDSITQK